FCGAARRVFAGTAAGDIMADGRELRVLRSSPFKGGWIIAFEGIADRSTAETWRGRTLLLPESEIEPPADGDIFIHDLVGMRVVRAGGDPVGDVTQVFEMPQGLVMDVRRTGGGGGSVMLPFDDHTVRTVDTDQRVIVVDPVEGLID
ncbi:MAG: ribosome maturation factor RimM, partial [Gemmatimonadaceae bacterium]